MQEVQRRRGDGVDIGQRNACFVQRGLDQRAEMRAAMLADPEWSDYLARVDGLLQTQNTRILTPTSFSPPQ